MRGKLSAGLLGLVGTVLISAMASGQSMPGEIVGQQTSGSRKTGSRYYQPAFRS